MVTKERMAALGRLSAAIAHEIRQPLTAMTGALKELARLAPLEDDDKKLVQIVSRESQRLNQIITDFLDYSREKTYAFSDVDVVALIEETLLLLERDATAAGKYRIERNFTVRSLRARADRDAMKQVFWNLCNNALRAMPDGRRAHGRHCGRRYLGAHSRSATRASASTRAQATRIFEPFQSGFIGGTGLGLGDRLSDSAGASRPNSRRSREGKGAEFIVEIPRAARPARATAPKLQDPREHASTFA